MNCRLALRSVRYPRVVKGYIAPDVGSRLASRTMYVSVLVAGR